MRPATGDDGREVQRLQELLGVEDGYRESAESWKTVLRELKRRGMVTPVVAVGDVLTSSSASRPHSDPTDLRMVHHASAMHERLAAGYRRM